MITNTGKSILGKYLIGQAPGYAAYMALGCGAKPLASTETPGNYSTKETLDFEMFRVPITSRGFVTENGTSQVVFTAELPTTERYEITEVGIFSAESNGIAGLYDSKPLFTFSNENWTDGTGATPTSTGTGVIDFTTLTTTTVYQTTADNAVFEDSARLIRHERPRYLNDVILINGDGGTVKIDGITLDLAQNSPTDIIKMALTVINVTGNSSPLTVDVVVDFSNYDGSIKATMSETVTNGLGAGQYDLNNNRYVVISKELQELTLTGAFSWNLVTKVTITVTANTTTAHWIALDGIRLENVSTNNPLYGMTGYSVLVTESGLPIIKQENTSNYVEFRFALDIGVP